MSPTAKISTPGSADRGSRKVWRSATAAMVSPACGRRDHCTSARARARIAAMFLTFFANLRQIRVPVTPREYLDLMGALNSDLAERSVDEFYRLARALLVKDERNLDKFDVVFAHTFKGVTSVAAAAGSVEMPEEWLRRLAERYLSPAERAEIE